MFVTPIKMVICKQVYAHPKGPHPPELGGIRQLAVLKGKAMVAAGVFHQGRVEKVEHQIGCLIAVGMGVNRDVCIERAFEDFGHLLRGHMPKPVGRTIMTPWPARAREKALYRSIGDDLDPAQAQSIGRAGFELESARDQIFGRVPHKEFERHNPRRKAGFAGDPKHHLDSLIFQLCGQIRHCGHTGAHAEFGKIPQTVFVGVENRPIHAQMDADGHVSVGTFQHTD